MPGTLKVNKKIWPLIAMCIFIYRLFKDVATSSDCKPSNVRIISANKLVVKQSSVHPTSTRYLQDLV